MINPILKYYMMYIPKEYIKNLLAKKTIPVLAWSIEYIDDKLCYTLKNEIYCKIFWMDLWYNYISEKYKSQYMIDNVENLDLTVSVMITRDLQLINAPKVIQNIVYFASTLERYKNPFRINISINAIFYIGICVFILVVILSATIFRNSNYTMMV